MYNNKRILDEKHSHTERKFQNEFGGYTTRYPEYVLKEYEKLDSDYKNITIDLDKEQIEILSKKEVEKIKIVTEYIVTDQQYFITAFHYINLSFKKMQN